MTRVVPPARKPGRVDANWRRLACSLLLSLVKSTGPKAARKFLDDLPDDLRPDIEEFYATWRRAHLLVRRAGEGAAG